MKKFRLLIMMVLLMAGGMGIATAQQGQQTTPPMRGYFQQTVLPFVKQQQAQLEQALTASEKAQLQKIREEVKNFRAQGAQMRKAMNGHFNQQVFDSRKAQWNAIVAKARQLVQAHPAAAEAYRRAMQTEMAKWKARMQALNGGKPMGRSQNMKGKNGHPFMERLADPAFGLLMETQNMGKMMMHARKKMQEKSMGRKSAGSGGIHPQRPFMMAMRNPAVRAKIMEYREKNILPVIRAQREAFDHVLSKKERKILDAARADMKAQREKMMSMRQSGNRPGDSARMVMQQQMDKDRIAVRKIMLDHYSALQKAMAPIKEKMPQWRTDIRKIVVEHMVQQQMKQYGRKQGPATHLMKQKGELMFLLMDPEHPENFLPLFGHGKK